MEYGINVNSIQKIINFNLKTKKETKTKIKTKIVENNFFIEKEIENSKLIEKNIQFNEKYGFFRYLTVIKHSPIKMYESYEDDYNNIFDLNNNGKKYLILEYKEHLNKDDNHLIYSFIYEENNYIFWRLIDIYELLLKNINFSTKNNIRWIDFSYDNLYYNFKDYCIYLNNFERFYNKVDLCKIHDNFDLYESSLNEFIKIMENIDYFGNKHFDLYFIKNLITKKDVFIIFNNLEVIIEDYINNLYFLKFFPDKIKKEILNKWTKYIKSMSIFERNTVNSQIIASNNWQLFLSYFLKYSHSKSCIWEMFSINSLFLNISIGFLKFFEVEDKNSILNRYIQFLFTNLDIGSSMDIILINEKYNLFMKNIEKTIFYDINPEKQEQLFEYITNNSQFF